MSLDLTVLVCVCVRTHRWVAGRTGHCRWCSLCGRGTTRTGMRMQTKTISQSSPWRRSLLWLWTMWTSSLAPAWETLCPAASTSKSKWTHTLKATQRKGRLCRNWWHLFCSCRFWGWFKSHFDRKVDPRIIYWSPKGFWLFQLDLNGLFLGEKIE